ncbi:MarR family transcriptional regulator [Kineothrix alysoides]|uniref:MarR family transcriptional regulator n=1 Tax=Kineothrix alysoides TaxID=1469948 RepID=A0A4R1QW91_9FIRM|nr:MarR family transcriptional regulator [Kineothrix alysoides]TCL57967.1 MarR family transcriptional regulator [Kineothrix alysoides]
MDTQGGFLITQIKQIGGRIFEKILSAENIDEFNGAQGKILYVLWQTDRISIVELAAQVGLANTTLTSMLDRMAEADLIMRIPDKADRRKNLIVLTEKARGLQEKYEQVSKRMNEIYYKDFTEQEIAQFEKQLTRILENLKEVN